MSLRMERSDQDEERKEEPAFVKVEVTRTGPRFALRQVFDLRYKVQRFLSPIEGWLHPVHHIDLEKADQRGSETRSTKVSYQDKGEWEEEPESGRAGDTWTGPCSAARRVFHLRSLFDCVLSSIHHDIDFQRAHQRRSESRRTEFSDQDKEEWEEEPESGRAGDTRTGPHSASRKPPALRSSNPPLMGENLSPAADDINNDTADLHRSETRRTESSAWGDGPFSPKTWSAAVVWIMMALTVLTPSLAGAECIGTEVKLDTGEAVLRCPLPVNARATGQGIIVKHFPTTGSADTVMYCYWPAKGADKPKCESSDGFSLVAPLTDQVVAKVPVSRLMDREAYKCQLYPLGDHKYFNPCHIHRFSDNDTVDDVFVTNKGSAVMPTPVVSSTAANRGTPGQDPLIRKAPPDVRQSGSVALTAAVLVLQVIIIILLVVNVLCLQNRKDQQSSETSEAEPMKCPKV